jgi:hypothetical protein
MFVRRLVPAFLLVCAAGTLGGGALRAGDVNETVLEGAISPLGLAVDDTDIYVANAFAGFVSVNGDFLEGIDGAGFVPGVDVDESGNVAYTATSFPEDPNGIPATLLNVAGSGTLANLSAFEGENNPDSGQWYGLLDASPSCMAKLAHKIGPDGLPYSGIVDSNPYAVLAADDGWFVADAAGNDILHVADDGSITTVAVLPPVPQVMPKQLRKELRVPRVDGAPNVERIKLPQCVVGQTLSGEPVPTDVEWGPDGDLYVSELPGFPELGGQVVSVDPETGAVSAPIITGLAGAVDLAVDADGNIYVAELFGNRVSKWSPAGQLLDAAFVLMPGAVEVEAGTVYATTGVFLEPPATGSVVTLSFD